jgi:HAD superfamily hydrolase (TIGR01549 family)
MAPLKVIVFDLYNTLLCISKKNSPYKDILRISPKPAATWEYIVTRYFTETEYLLKNLHMKGLIDTNIDQEVFQEKIKSELGSVELYPEVSGILEEIKKQGYKLGVISNLTTPYISPFFRHDLDKLVDYIVFSCELGYTKPSPEIYRQLLKQAICDFKELSFENMLMVGNSYPNDVRAPKELGMKAILLNRLGTKQKGEEICSLSELFNYM